jgi:Holliday junction resolvase
MVLKHPRAKGRRFEREIVEILGQAGYRAKRVPLSGGAEGFPGDIHWEIVPGYAIIIEAKNRKSAPIKKLQEWLGDKDMLVLKTGGEIWAFLPLKRLLEWLRKLHKEG